MPGIRDWERAELRRHDAEDAVHRAASRPDVEPDVHEAMTALLAYVKAVHRMLLRPQ
jgi:hypothetical protein